MTDETNEVVEAPVEEKPKKKRVNYKEIAAKHEAELVDMKDKYLRLAADMDNVRKNALKDRQAYVKYKNESIGRDLLPVIDDFERCLSHMPETEDEAVKGMADGVELVYNKLVQALSKNSIAKMDVKPGDAFDVNKHEAVSIVAAGDEFVDKVVAVTDCGYMLADKVIRYAKVVVGQKS